MATALARPWLALFGLVPVLVALALSAPAARAAAPACDSLLPGFMHCDAVKNTQGSARAAGINASGYGPADLQSAYGLTSFSASYGSDQTVAVIDSYDSPSAESELGVYRARFGLPPCTTANGCFRKVNQYGGSTPPAPNSDWAEEISLDLDMVSAVCPHCHILLVEANSNYATDLAAAVDEAAALGATQITNSYGYPEQAGEQALEPYYRHPGIAVTVSSGDGGYGVQYPAASQYVIAVGGTSLYRGGGTRGWTESAWGGSGSGCSAYIPKPAWQTDTSCAGRSVADVSAVADPNTGVAVYGESGWQIYGGTSAAAPIVAAAYALTGASAASNFGSYAYSNPSYFNDVTSGSNAASCTFTYLCTAGAGFDGPTGMGTPASAHPSGPPPPITDSGSSTSTSTITSSSSTQAPSGVTLTPPQRIRSVAPLHSSISVAPAAVAALRSSHIALRLSCARGRPACHGVLSIQARIHHKLRTLARRSYSLQPGKSRIVHVKLPARYRRLVHTLRKLRAYGTARDSDGTRAQASLTLRATISRSKTRRSR